jgi:tRNA A-37 threonylcarbamoyl transferase component Bud32
MEERSMRSRFAGYREVSAKGLRGCLREDLCSRLPAAFFEDPFSCLDEGRGEIIKESTWRRAGIFSLEGGRRIFLKRDRTKGLFEKMKYRFLPSKGRREWLLALQLRKKNVRIPEPLGWMERVRRGWVEESYYLSEAVGSGGALIDDSLRLKERGTILRLAQTVRAVHDAGLNHLDFHAGNFLWDGDSLLLTDLHDSRIVGSLSRRQRLWNLSHLFHSLRSAWGEGEEMAFAQEYWAGDSISDREREAFRETIHGYMKRLQKRQWRSRSKRCLKESSEFSVVREGRFVYHHRRDFPLDRVKGVVREYRRLLSTAPAMLAKDSARVAVGQVRDDGNDLWVKEFRYPEWCDRMKDVFRTSKGLKGWISANGLRARGLPSIKPLALVEEKAWRGAKEGLFIMEGVEGGLEMDRFLSRTFDTPDQKRSFVRTFARWLSGFHRMDLYHRDMKTCNVLVLEKGDTWEFFLLDLEDVLLDHRVREKDLLRSLVQLNTSTPRLMSRTDRLRFFGEYLRLHPILPDRKAFLRRLIEESRRRGLVYVSPGGVVIQEM